jgi:hypothetical protein
VNRRALLLLAATLLGPLRAGAEPAGPPRVLLLDFALDPPDGEQGQELGTFAADALVRRNGARAITPDSTDSALTPELKARLPGCASSTGCLIEVGRGVGAARVLAGEARRLGATTFLSFQVVDPTRGASLGRLEEQVTGRSPALLRAAVQRLVEGAMEGLRRTGTISVELPARARLELDGQTASSGQGRVEVVTGAGGHRVVVLVEGHERWEVDALLQPGETLRLDPKPQKLDDRAWGPVNLEANLSVISNTGTNPNSAGAMLTVRTGTFEYGLFFNKEDVHFVGLKRYGALVGLGAGHGPVRGELLLEAATSRWNDVRQGATLLAAGGSGFAFGGRAGATLAAGPVYFGLWLWARSAPAALRDLAQSAGLDFRLGFRFPSYQRPD